MLIDTKSLSDAKSSLHASASCRVADAKKDAPLFHAESLSVHGVEQRVSSVAYLLHSGSPYAVFLAVSGIVIDSFYRKLGKRSKAHIFEKVMKGKPAIRHGYSSCSIVFIAGVFGIGASLNNVLPANILRGSAHAMQGFLLIMKAAARACSSIPEVVAANGYRFSALASTIPVTAPRLVSANNCKSGEGHSTLQYFSGHNFSTLGAVC